MPVPLAWASVVAGFLAVFATYWDEAWHTDIGRDSAWAAPHVLLYGSVAVVGLAVAGWGLRVLVSLRSLRGTLAQPPLVASGLGGLGALIAAPIDAGWHEAYGRDAVLFSPPHMLVVLASTALVLGVLAGLPGDAPLLSRSAGVLLMANALAVVFEYEADVPQFSEKYYLPLLLAVGLTAGYVVRRVVPGRMPVVSVVVGYAVLRLMIGLALGMLGRSTPDLPIAVLGFAALDLPLRRRTAAATTTVIVSVTAVATSASGLASPELWDVTVVAVPTIVLCLVVLLGNVRRGMAGVVPLGLFAGLVGALAPAQRVDAHDPGQGTPVVRAVMTARTGVSGRVVLMVRATSGCDGLTPRSIVARRAGSTRVSTLTPAGGRCGYEGSLNFDRGGRWFVYATFTRKGHALEGWVPVEIGTPGRLRMTRTLYVPAGRGVGLTGGQLAVGSAIYLVGLGLLASGVRAVRFRPVIQPALEPG